MQMNKDFLVPIVYSCSLLLLSACSHTREQTITQPNVKEITDQKLDKEHLKIGQQIANLAKLQVGNPYRYGGATPNGFDCSGLVYYTHGKLGIRTPRTSRQLYSVARPIKLSKLETGDVVFFKLNNKKISHVGIYIGKGRFVHAPNTGRKVSTNQLSDPFWKSRIIGGGRLY